MKCNVAATSDQLNTNSPLWTTRRHHQSVKKETTDPAPARRLMKEMACARAVRTFSFYHSNPLR
jgi:hypothetical protein